VGWISRQNLLPSGRERIVFLTSLLIELIDIEKGFFVPSPVIVEIPEHAE
jgi:hypothetical protein